MSTSDDSDMLMQLIRAKLEKITGNPSYNALTPAVHEHYHAILSKLVDGHFEARFLPGMKHPKRGINEKEQLAVTQRRAGEDCEPAMLDPTRTGSGFGWDPSELE